MAAQRAAVKGKDDVLAEVIKLTMNALFGKMSQNKRKQKAFAAYVDDEWLPSALATAQRRELDPRGLILRRVRALHCRDGFSCIPSTS